MIQLPSQALSFLVCSETPTSLADIRHGLEKESLRVDIHGHLAQTPHPPSLGSALTHPEITTDYAEALLEFITPAYTDLDQTLAHLDTILRYVYPQLGDELLWTASMPCVLNGDNSIPVARYGTTNSGQMKTIYRLGLGHRYGRAMQTIAGIHYNFSLPDSFWRLYQNHLGLQGDLQEVKNQAYFAIIRNFRRYVWLLIYLFGASPAVCGSFVAGRDHGLEKLSKGTYYAPYGTALRMGDLGYQSSAQESLYVSYASVDAYIRSLLPALTNSLPEYEAIGVKVNGAYQQLSTALLQIENEFYSVIRPKRTTQSGEAPIKALHERGVEYIEVRCVDINPYTPLGVDSEQLRFIDIFLLYCLLQDSPDLCPREYAQAISNVKTVVRQGRQPGLTLVADQAPRSMQQWGNELLDAMKPIAQCLDACAPEVGFSAIVEKQRHKLADSSHTPSARIIADLQSRNLSYSGFTLAQSIAHKAAYLSRPLNNEETLHYQTLAEHSLRQQEIREQHQDKSFEAFLAAYYAQYEEVASRLDAGSPKGKTV